MGEPAGFVCREEAAIFFGGFVLDDEDPEFRAEVAARHGFNVAEEMVAHPIHDDEIIGAQRDRVAPGFVHHKGSDPGGEFLVTQHLSEVR